MDDTMNEVLEQETTAAETDSFLSGFGNEGGFIEESAVEAPESASEESLDEGVSVDTADDAGISEDKPAETSIREEELPWNRTWMHLGEEKKFSREEIDALIQKGMDYDRIRGRYDENQPFYSLLQQFAKEAGMSVQDYSSMIRRQAKVSSGSSEEEARLAVELEDAKAANAVREAEEQEANAQRDAADKAARDAESRRKAEVSEFIKTFPGVGVKDIPNEVWEQVNHGQNLTVAYSVNLARQAVGKTKELETQRKAMEQERENASRTTGSVSTSGNQRRNDDAFLSGLSSDMDY